MVEVNRDVLGQWVREEWVKFAKEQAATTGQSAKFHHLLSWEELDEANKEVDRRIGERIFNEVGQECLNQALDYGVLVEFIQWVKDGCPQVVRLRGSHMYFDGQPLETVTDWVMNLLKIPTSSEQYAQEMEKLKS